MSGRAFSKFVLTHVDEQTDEPAFVQQVGKTDEERRRQMKAYARTMKGTAGYGDTFGSLGLSDSEDEESGVPSIDKILAEIDKPPLQKDAACDVPAIRKALEDHEGKNIDAVRDFIGSGLDGPRSQPTPLAHVTQRRIAPDLAPAITNSSNDGCDQALAPRRRGKWQAQMEEKVRREGKWQAQMAVLGERQKAETAKSGSWRTRMAEAAERQAQKERLEAEKRQQLVDRGFSFPSVDHFVQSTALVARGAASEPCNGVFVYHGNHKGRSLFKNESGAIMFFNEVWKMNSSYKVTSSLYISTASTSLLPPVGLWISGNSRGPTVAYSSAPRQVYAESGEQLMFEDGETWQKSMENKTWCWVEPDSTEAEATPS